MHNIYLLKNNFTFPLVKILCSILYLKGNNIQSYEVLCKAKALMQTYICIKISHIRSFVVLKTKYDFAFACRGGITQFDKIENYFVYLLFPK